MQLLQLRKMKLAKTDLAKQLQIDYKNLKH